MRQLLSVGLLVALASGAWAKPKPKPVSVTNFPASQAVQVQNFPASQPAAVPLAPTKASQLVTLTPSGAACPGFASARVFDQRVNADGTVAAFSIPAGQVLVVTGLDWRQGNTAPAPQEEVFLYYANVGGTVVDSLSAASAGNRAGANVQVSGVAVAAGSQLCFQMNTGNMDSATAVLHGFLAIDE